MENEIECWDDIEPLEEVLIAVEPVASERYQHFIERGRTAFRPAIPSIAGFELTVMSDTIGKLAEVTALRRMAAEILSLIVRLRAPPAPAHLALNPFYIKRFMKFS